MARPRTPTALLELRGSFKHDPQRRRARQNEPIVSAPLPDPPSRINEPAVSTWQELKAQGFWLTSADRFLVEIAAALMTAYRRDRLKSADTAMLIGLLSKLGFSPRERGALNLPDKQRS